MTGALGHRTINALHGRLVFGGRVRALARNLAEMIPTDSHTVLDCGCGDGSIASTTAGLRSDLKFTGLEIQLRPATAIPVQVYDGTRIPFADKSHDVVMLIDVLHHAEDPHRLLSESARVARRAVLIKDHLTDAWLGNARLRAMDWVGNVGHGVDLRYEYWSRAQWCEAFNRAGLVESSRREKLGLYAPGMRWAFETNLHFIAALHVSVPLLG